MKILLLWQYALSIHHWKGIETALLMGFISSKSMEKWQRYRDVYMGISKKIQRKCIKEHDKMLGHYCNLKIKNTYPLTIYAIYTSFDRYCNSASNSVYFIKFHVEMTKILRVIYRHLFWKHWHEYMLDFLTIFLQN